MSVHPQSQRPCLWPERLITLASNWAEIGIEERRRNLGQIWLIVNEAISAHIWKDTKGNGDMEPDDVYDIASEKALDLLLRLDRGEWRLTGTTPGRVSSYIATIARNALIDHMRTTGVKRQRSIDIAAMGSDDRDRRSGRMAAQREGADAGANRNQFVSALKDCVAALRPRARVLWLMRVLLGMASKDIACHPEVQMNPASVDVALGRARKLVRNCMKKKGFEPHELPPGTVAALWEAFRYETGEW